MFGDPSDAPLVVDFLLVHDFSLIAFASAIEPLRLANRVAGRELYRWRITSLDGQVVVASGGVPV
ncbi:MAG: GlxA family transcriptional regulator, partial [Pseudomonadota bacterium]|nr:GlxA family transcriptional regulator [Pseudomonadota bacterium]